MSSVFTSNLNLLSPPAGSNSRARSKQAFVRSDCESSALTQTQNQGGFPSLVYTRQHGTKIPSGHTVEVETLTCQSCAFMNIHIILFVSTSNQHLFSLLFFFMFLLTLLRRIQVRKPHVSLLLAHSIPLVSFDSGGFPQNSFYLSFDHSGEGEA